MIQIRRSLERGHINLGWLDTYHTFSFGNYFDSKHMGFRNLRVINQDRVEPKKGFDTHPHKNMEIITYVIQGQIEHQDSLGTKQQISAGQIQVMSAGSGIRHSENNPSESSTLELLQIWILPNKVNLKPRYSDLTIPEETVRNQLGLIVSPDGRNNSAMIHQDVFIFATKTNKNIDLQHNIKKDRYAWLQIVKGRFLINKLELAKGDGAAVSEESIIKIQNLDSDGEFLLFDLN
ncbi:MAG: pirin family protein [Bdellovibrionaceae bacterium]|nr:pirin family protein [Pseudobdellovibrionaceae bacterium]